VHNPGRFLTHIYTVIDMKKRYRTVKFTLVLTALISVVFTSCSPPFQSERDPADASLIKVSGEMKAVLTSPPYVPVSVGKRGAMKLSVDMEIVEREGTMTNGVTYIYWTFGGTVPGSFIRT